MTRTALSLALGLACLAGLAAPAAAGGEYYPGSIKDHGSAVAVPAPIPVPIYEPVWYFRADAAIGGGSSEISETGLSYGLGSVGGPVGINEAWLDDDDFSVSSTVGVGVGRYLSENWRVDLTGEYRVESKAEYRGSYGYTVDLGGGDSDRYSGSVRDETTLRGGIFLANLYYDMPRLDRMGLTPYIGAGLGFVWHETKRNHWTDETVQNCPAGVCGAATGYQSLQVQDKAHSIALAASAMAGVSYAFNEYITLDMGYRFLYLGDTQNGLTISGDRIGSPSKVEIGPSYEHQLRAGLRLDVN